MTRAIEPGKCSIPQEVQTPVLKKLVSILGLAAIVAVWSAEPQAVNAGETPQARLAAAAHDCPRPGLDERRFGPYGTLDEAKQKCYSLEREHPDWYCYIKKCSHCQVWYVFGRRNHF
jgi:hypothetical protein